MGKIGIMTLALNEERLIGACLKQFKGFPIERHIVAITTEPWNKGSVIPDKTEEIALAMGAKVVKKAWPEEVVQRQEILGIFEGFEWVLIVDADEFYTKADLTVLFEQLTWDKSPAVKVPRMEIFWRNR